MSAAPVVSVVTPVYNGAEYLEECIFSVVRQTYSDWEYVIMDNMSTDGSAEIAERYAAQDHRIRVIRANEFLDANANHNRSLRAMHPHSRYMKMVHADDWLYPECLEQMVRLAEQHPSVGVVSSYRLVGNHVEHESPRPYSQPVMPGPELVRWEMFGPRGSAWATGSNTSVLVRADFVGRTRDFYDCTVWNADTDAAYRVLMESDFGFVHQVLTFTRRHTGAQMALDYRVWSFIARDVRFVLRYGPRLMPATEYRAQRRKWLRLYGIWLAKQAVKPARHKQKEFHEFHRREIDYMLIEARDDRPARVALAACRRLLRD
jgi:glycosyltransferase involved in cell wall biosynthesis